MANDDPYTRKEPPESEDEWQDIWAAVDRAHKAWVIVGPIFAVVTNWKALVIASVLIVYINRPELATALEALIGVNP